jgi:hypothetical protein
MIFDIPKQITQGDRVTWSQDLDKFFPAVDILACFVRGGTALDLTGVGNGFVWDFTITETQSQALPPGNYKTQFVVFGTGTGRQTLGSTDLLVLPSFESLTTLDTRSPDEIELEQITTAIAKLASGAVAEYRIADRMMRYQDLSELTNRQQYLRNRVAKIKNPGGIGGRNVGIRFSNH